MTAAETARYRRRNSGITANYRRYFRNTKPSETGIA
jgi:hypothetical protein